MGKVKAKQKKTKRKKSKHRKVTKGVAHILATFNNTIVTLTDVKGDTLVQKSPPQLGFKNSKKSTAFAATKAAMEASSIAKKKYGLVEVEVVIKGIGAGRDAAVKGIDGAGIKITKLIDRTPIPHNGCRPPVCPRK